MKILFVMRDIKMCEHLGIMYISSMLKMGGHTVDLVQTDLEDYIKKISKFSPDVLAYSTTTGEHKHLIAVNKKIKENFPKIITIFGGPHPTFFPEMIENEGVDVICRGEGEFIIVDLVNALENKKPIEHIPGLWVKKKGKIYKNQISPLIYDLDTIPFPDREIMYGNDKNLNDFGEKRILIGRGCPFRCTYCFNNRLSGLYGAEWGKIRKRSVGNVIKEVKEIKKKYPVEFIRIVDDTFIMCSKEWLGEFAERFKKEVNIPFFCNVRANLVTEENVGLLKKAGCFSVFMGVETGDEEVRNTILKRNMTNDQLFKACRLLRKYRIKYGFYNMFGLPVKNALEVDFKTLDLNIKLKPTMAWSSIFTPFPHTELGDYCIKHGYFNGNFDDIQANPKISSSLKFRSDKEKREIENLHKLFGITVEFPFLRPLTKQLIKLPPNKIFNIINMGWYGWVLKARMSTIRITIPKLFRWAKVVMKHTKSE